MFLCSIRARNAVLASFPIAHRATLKLRCNYEYQVHVINVTGPQDTRLCIQCPELPTGHWSHGVNHACKLGEVLKFAASITDTPRLRPYFTESSTVVSAILRQAEKEKHGALKMTSNTLDNGVLVWLARKGFSDAADIRQLEQLAGSITQGLLMLFHALPKRPRNLSQEHSLIGLGKRRREQDKEAHFNPESWQAVKLHVKSVHDRPTAQKQSSSRQSINAVSGQQGEIPSPKDLLVRTIQETGDQDGPITDFLSGASAQSRLVPPVSDLQYELCQGFSAPTEDEDDVSAQDLRLSIINSHLQGELRDGPEAGQRDALDEFESPRMTMQSKRSGPGTTHNWWEEGLVYQDKKYRRIVPSRKAGQRRKVYIWYCDIPFPNTMDLGNNIVEIGIDICAIGETHASLFATNSRAEDPARRLGFNVTGVDKSGNRFLYQPDQSGEKAVAKANTLVDVLVNGTSLNELAARPRRYLFFKKGKAPAGLEEFEGGKYTSLEAERD